MRGSAVSASRIQAFITQNADLLSDPRVCIGLWYDEENDVTYLDVTAALPERRAAIELGQIYNQIAVYDLEASRVIDTDGTGEEIPSNVPEAKRLPQLIRQEGKKDD